MITIVVCNQKGGVSKTTMTAIIAAGLSGRGFKVLALDIDPQFSLTQICCNEYEHTIVDVLEGRISGRRATIKTEHGFSIIPGSLNLSEDTKNFTLQSVKQILRPLMASYDYCIVDTPPSLSKQTISGLIAADYAIIPVAPAILSYNGLMQLKQTIEAVQDRYNAGLAVLGVLVTDYDTDAVLDKSMIEAFSAAADLFDTEIFNSVIRHSRYIPKMQLWKDNLFRARPKATVTQDCNRLIDEIIERTGNNGK